MELLTLFKYVEVLVDASKGCTLTFSTDLSGNAMTVKATVVLPATAGRHPYRITLPGWTKGKLFSLKITPNGQMAIYEAKVYARVLGPAPTAWAWYMVPVLPTPVEWQPVNLPIIPTSETWEERQLPIPPTGQDWSEQKLPIQPTSEDWSELKLPVLPTPPIPSWVNVEVDQ